MNPESPISPEMISGKGRGKLSGNSGITIDTGIPDTRETGAFGSEFQAPIEVMPGQTRILLSEAASRHLDVTGEECFMIVTKARVPDMVGRWVIHLVPCSMEIARNAESVLMGKARAVKSKIS